MFFLEQKYICNIKAGLPEAGGVEGTHRGGGVMAEVVEGTHSHIVDVT